MDILVSAERLNDLIAGGACIPVDCRFEFTGAERGRAQWRAGHIPGARYAHLDEDLAAPVEDHTGRHPLPETDAFARYLASIGWTGEKLLVAYDAGSGALASRLWWLMRYYGKPAAILDGGLAAWTAAGFELESGEVEAAPAPVEHLVPAEDATVDTEALAGDLASRLVVDARSAERFSGAVETLDTKAGHIPGARNRPFDQNLGEDGRFKTPETLRSEFEGLLNETHPERVVHSCGSGVTACHNLFAMELAGIGGSRLYPGSWSEWIRDPRRPIATGD
ncbi:MAG: sulfurtransferase [Gammaproteobacteria bacterium]|nr:sulfurtransferase [Gammaproteobacteria bacterium]